MKNKSILFWNIKPYLLCTLILVTIILICFISLNTIHSSSSHMISITHNVMEDIDKNDWAQAEKDIDTFSDTWSQYKSRWSIFLDHKKAMTIDEQTVKIVEHIKNKNKSLAKSELSILLESLNHYPQEELPLIENIL